jgi:hypothetical protein
MSESKPPPPAKPLRFEDIGFVSLFFFLCSLSGFLTVVGNITGLALRFDHIVPVVANLHGLMTTTLLLFFLGLIPLLPRIFRRPPSGATGHPTPSTN